MTRLGLALSAFLALTACGSQPQKATLQKDIIACKLRGDLVTLQTMFAKNDQGTFSTNYERAINSGDCKWYVEKTAVLIDKSESHDGKNFACIRTSEEAVCRWMQEL